MNDFIELLILESIRRILYGRVNELLTDLEMEIPFVNLSDYKGGSAVVPIVDLFGCERTEKERIILQDAYTVTVTFNVPEKRGSDFICFAYAWAVCKALGENVTLDGVADRLSITGKKYIPPKVSNCGMDCQVVITLRITVEGMNYA